MISKVNLKARIKRHSKVFKDNFHKVHPLRSLYYRFNYNIVVILVILVFPIYPVFASFIYNNEYEFYRGNIDESSILAYDSYNSETLNDELILKDSFFSVNTFLDEERNLDGVNEILDYKVKTGESFSSIAYKFKITPESIYWANSFPKNKVLRIGDVIKIPAVSGLIHYVKSGENLSSIAKKYGIKESIIENQNKLNIRKLSVGMSIIIPGAKKKEPVKTYAKSKYYPKKSTSYSFGTSGKSQYVKTDGLYKLVKRKPQHHFYWGNCTWFVGQYKNVNWGGNANQWMRNAKAKGIPTGKNPGVGAIVVFNGRGYNPRYGHVGIVVDVNINDIIIKDMNYRRLNEITTRKIPKSDRAIMGYIYVD